MVYFYFATDGRGNSMHRALQNFNTGFPEWFLRVDFLFVGGVKTVLKDSLAGPAINLGANGWLQHVLEPIP